LGKAQLRAIEDIASNQIYFILFVKVYLGASAIFTQIKVKNNDKE